MIVPLTRITNGAHIAPATPRFSTSSGESWSSASRYSVSDVESPQPPKEQNATQSINPNATTTSVVTTSSIKIKLVVGIIVVVGCLVVAAIVLGVTLPLTLNKSIAVTTSHSTVAATTRI